MGISNKNDSNRIFVKFFFKQAKDCLGFVEDFFGSLIFEATLFNGILHFVGQHANQRNCCDGSERIF